MFLRTFIFPLQFIASVLCAQTIKQSGKKISPCIMCTIGSLRRIYWPIYIGWLLTDYWLTIGRLTVDSWPIHDWYFTGSWSLHIGQRFGQLLGVHRLTVIRILDGYSVNRRPLYRPRPPIENMIQALKRAKKEVFIKIIIILILFGPFLGITLPFTQTLSLIQIRFVKMVDPVLLLCFQVTRSVENLLLTVAL